MSYLPMLQIKKIMTRFISVFEISNKSIMKQKKPCWTIGHIKKPMNELKKAKMFFKIC